MLVNVKFTGRNSGAAVFFVSVEMICELHLLLA
jgi:hypothetical protein